MKGGRVLLPALALLAAASADEVHLKSGGLLRGEIREETPQEIVLASAGGILRIDRTQVESVTRSAYAPEKRAPERVPSPEPRDDGKDPRSLLDAAMPLFTSFDYSEEAEAAARSLVEGGPAMVPLIADALPGASPTQQKWLAEVLGEIRDPAGGKVVLDLVHSPQGELRVVSAQVLAILKHPQAPQILVNLLADGDWNVRLAAARGLSVIKSRDAIPRLIDHLEDSSLLVRGAAHDALTTITDADLPARQEDWRAWLLEHPVGKERVGLNGRPVPHKEVSP